MQNLTPEHEDSRRALFSFPEAKVLEVKEDCVLGRHFHKEKTECFILSKGECLLYKRPAWTDTGIADKMEIGKMYEIPALMFHEFHIKAGSILIGLNSKPFDATDDYKL